MTDPLPLLKTKLEIPIHRRDLVVRNRLTEKLSTCISDCTRLILVSAPAGYGKTTLVSEWLDGQQMQKAWVSLESDDSDPVRFWKYIAASLRNQGSIMLQALNAPPIPPIQMILTQLLNELSCLDSRLVLVLDDYHQISSPDVHETLTFFIDHLPQQVHLVIVSRTDPPLPLARLRAKQQMREVRCGELKFTSSEIEGLLASAGNVNLTEKDLALLEERTEGWAVGLQLAVLSLDNESDATGFISSFAGDNRYILDYLLEEVLNRQSPEVRAFLLQTSVLDILSGPLCDALINCETADKDADEDIVAGKESCRYSSHDILEYLESRNLFVIPLSQRREFYRYHHLFADLLRYQLENNPISGLPAPRTLHRRAAKWHHANGYTAHAVKHFLKSGDTSRALDLIETLAWPMIQSGEHATVTGWLETIDDQEIIYRPGLCLRYAWALYYMGQPGKYTKYIDAAESAWTENNDPRLGEVFNLKADLYLNGGSADDVETMANCALKRLDPEDDSNRGMAYMYLGFAALLRGQFTQALPQLEKAKQLSHATDNLYGYSRSTNAILQAHVALGNLVQGEEFFRQFMETLGDRVMYIMILNHILLSAILMEQNRLTEANEHLQTALAGMESNTFDVYFISGYLILSWLKHLLGDDHSAHELVQCAEINARNLSSPVLISKVCCCKARLAMANNNLADARKWVKASGLSLDPELGFVFLPELVILIRIAIESNEIDSVLPILDILESKADTENILSQKLKILVLRALALSRSGNTQRARYELTRAIKLGEPNGYIRVFADEGPSICELLKQIKPSRQQTNYLKTIINAFDTSPSRIERPGSSLPGSHELLEQLTLRERDVLELIASGLSNRDIGNKLYISLNTVKVHLKNIYGKLGVSSRTQAVARAGELNLI